MLRQREIKKFEGKKVSIGIPHKKQKNALFFYNGFLKSVENNEVKLRIEDGFKIIKIKNIKYISKDKRGGI